MKIKSHKPKFDEFLGYVRFYFNGMEITDAEIESLRKIYDDVTRDDLARALKFARSNASFNPLSTIIRQLKMFKPSLLDINRQQNVTYNFQGKKIEKGTDWAKKIQEAKENRKEVSRKQLAALKQWFINFDWAIFPNEDHHYVKIDDNSDNFFKSLRKSQDDSRGNEKHSKHHDDPETLKLIREVLEG